MIYSHDYPRENLLLSRKGTFSCMSFTFAPLVGVKYFRAFFGRERCVLCFCALKKNHLWTHSKKPVGPKKSQSNGLERLCMPTEEYTYVAHQSLNDDILNVVTSQRLFICGHLTMTTIIFLVSIPLIPM
jgi:hypothetical protein